MNNYIITTDVGVAQEVVPTFGGEIIKSRKRDDFIIAINDIVSLNDEELNKLVPDISKETLTWKYILDNNQGILKLKSINPKEISSIKYIFLKVLTPFSLMFLISITLLEYSYHQYIYKPK